MVEEQGRGKTEAGGRRQSLGQLEHGEGAETDLRKFSVPAEKV
jgi:hypothetical protein